MCCALGVSSTDWVRVLNNGLRAALGRASKEVFDYYKSTNLLAASLYHDGVVATRAESESVTGHARSCETGAFAVRLILEQSP